MRPLPLRRSFWKTLPKLLREGTVLIGHELAEQEDNRNAAQAVLIGHIHEALISRFTRPVLVKSCDFYAAFFVAYQKTIRETELRVWEEFQRSFEEWTENNPGVLLNEKWAAYLTYAFRGYREPPASHELYMNMAPLARVYEYLMRKKYGKRFSYEQLYSVFRCNLPKFLLRYIGMDTLLGALIPLNLCTRETRVKGYLVTRYSYWEPLFFILNENDSLAFKPAFIEAICTHAQKQGFQEDHQGRTEDRGCPFLFSNVRNDLTAFAVEELIAQHELWHSE